MPPTRAIHDLITHVPLASLLQTLSFPLLPWLFPSLPLLPLPYCCSPFPTAAPPSLRAAPPSLRVTHDLPTHVPISPLLPSLFFPLFPSLSVHLLPFPVFASPPLPLIPSPSFTLSTARGPGRGTEETFLPSRLTHSPCSLNSIACYCTSPSRTPLSQRHSLTHFLLLPTSLLLPCLSLASLTASLLPSLSHPPSILQSLPSFPSCTSLLSLLSLPSLPFPPSLPSPNTFRPTPRFSSAFAPVVLFPPVPPFPLRFSSSVPHSHRSLDPSRTPPFARTNAPFTQGNRLALGLSLTHLHVTFTPVPHTHSPPLLSLSPCPSLRFPPCSSLSFPAHITYTFPPPTSPPPTFLCSYPPFPLFRAPLFRHLSALLSLNPLLLFLPHSLLSSHFISLRFTVLYSLPFTSLSCPLPFPSRCPYPLACSDSMGMLDTPCTTIRTAALADAKTVVVGWKNQGWKPSVKTWWPPFVAKGDKIVFKWNDWRRKHNVVSVSDWNYNLCFFGKSDYKVYVLTKPSNKGRLVVLVTLDVSDKKYYRGFFTSSVGNDCRKGMKVALLRPALR
ncbi:unnamed protein product [Closterium sp. NIES-65]|nr:unnamed protein product [Closterium sp. NIES-65]